MSLPQLLESVAILLRITLMDSLVKLGYSPDTTLHEGEISVSSQTTLSYFENKLENDGHPDWAQVGVMGQS